MEATQPEGLCVAVAAAVDLVPGLLSDRSGPSYKAAAQQ